MIIRRFLHFIIGILLVISSTVQAQDFQSIIGEAERLESIPNEKEALNKFKEALKLQPLNLYALTKCSELCSRIGNREKHSSTRDSYYQAAMIYARNALKHFPNNDESHVVAAIAAGRVALTKSGKEKIISVKEIKQHAETALRLNPNNFKAWHILGKWNYEVSSLSVIERAATKLFYGGLPKASFKESIAAYEKAKAINPGFALNYLELAKAYKKNDNKTKAIEQLKLLQTLPVKTEDDPRIKNEGAELLRDLQN